jgi:hypothetical protein
VDGSNCFDFYASRSAWDLAVDTGSLNGRPACPGRHDRRDPGNGAELLEKTTRLAPGDSSWFATMTVCLKPNRQGKQQ